MTSLHGNLVEKDVTCENCGVRSRAGFAPPKRPCLSGNHVSAGHAWIRTDRLDNEDRDPVGYNEPVIADDED